MKFLAENIAAGKIFLAKKILADFFSSGSRQVAVNRWQLAVDRFHFEFGRWHVAQLSGAVRKAGIRCPHQLVVGGGISDRGAGAG